MKLKIIFGTALLASLAYADGYIVPDLNGNANYSYDSSSPLPLMSPDVPLDERDTEALKYSNLWLKSERYPHQEGDRVVYLFGSGQPTLVCSPLQVCVIYLQAGEKIVPNGAHLGDAVRWHVSPAVGADNRTQLVIKPIDVGLSTTLAVITDRRTYHIKLVSRQNDYMPGIAFKYPSDLNAQWEKFYKQEIVKKEHQSMPDGSDITKLDFNYYISGCDCDFRPVRIFNDGQQTIIEMNKSLNNSEIPALLLSSKQGNQLVNYRYKDNKYIVDRLFKEAILIRGVGRNQEKVIITWNGK